MLKKLRLKDLRENNNYTQEEIAEKLKLNRKTYSDYEIERNLIPITKLCTISEFYDVSLDYIVGLTSQKEFNGKRKNFDINELRKNIKKYRLQKNMTQQELGIILGASKQTISSYETGKRLIPIDVLINLSKLFNITLDELAGIIK